MGTNGWRVPTKQAERVALLAGGCGIQWSGSVWSGILIFTGSADAAAKFRRRGVSQWSTMPQTNPQFSVDTHIFRELGELLVGRESTALLEMIKNSYDADASEIVVTATESDYPDRAHIVIQDNGCGMSAEQFVNGFLRIASRFKDEGERRSNVYRRRYTGSKGIGRLAAHKLAQVMDIASVCGIPAGMARQAIEARIDWELIESKETLGEAVDGITLMEPALRRPAPVGTTITLSKLRQTWTPAERARFVAECRSCQVPEILTIPLPRRVLDSSLLFEKPVVRDVTGADPGFAIRLEGDFAEGDDYWEALVDQTGWVLEIVAARGDPQVRYGIAPTRATMREFPEVRRREFEHPHPLPDEGPFFQARILLRDEQIRGKKVLAGWAIKTGGVRVYLEGFRVLPYGEPNDDWLRLNANAVRRSWELTEGFEKMFDEEDEGPDDWQQFASPNSSYTGAVFLIQAEAPSLRMLVNREGFVADRGFEAVVALLRIGNDLLTRTRAAGKYPELQRRKVKREEEQRAEARRAAEAAAGSAGPSSGRGSSAAPAPTPSVPVVTPPLRRTTLNEAATRANAAVDEVRRILPVTSEMQPVRQQLDVAQSVVAELVTAADRTRDAEAMLRVLASVGTQMASFVHEIRGLLSTVVAVHERVGQLRGDTSVRGHVRERLAEVYASLGDLRRQVERQATYLVDVTAPDARRRRSRQKLAEQFDAAARLVGPAIERRNITLRNEISSTLKSPPMFAAEITSVFSNLLTNAVKAAGQDGKIRARGNSLPGGVVVVVVENSGVDVDLADAERWFQPFESTTTEVDSVLGQGMGLGLTITRDMLEQYGATIKFVPPSGDFKTAIEVRFPE